jgi:hypothetical protein
MTLWRSPGSAVADDGRVVDLVRFDLLRDEFTGDS